MFYSILLEDEVIGASEIIGDLFSIYFLLIIWFGFLVFTLRSQLQSFEAVPRGRDRFVSSWNSSFHDNKYLDFKQKMTQKFVYSSIKKKYILDFQSPEKSI